MMAITKKKETNLLKYIIKIMHNIAGFAPSSFVIFRYEMMFAHLLAMQLSAATYIVIAPRQHLSTSVGKKEERKKEIWIK